MEPSTDKTRSSALDRGVTFTLRLVASDDRDEDLLETFRSLLAPLRAATGCVRCSLLGDIEKSDEVELFVEWLSQEDFVRHVKSSLFRKVLVAMELAAEPPDLKIGRIVGVRGMGLVREILGCQEGGPEGATSRGLGGEWSKAPTATTDEGMG